MYMYFVTVDFPLCGSSYYAYVREEVTQGNSNLVNSTEATANTWQRRMCYMIPEITSADHLAASMAANLFSSTYQGTGIGRAWTGNLSLHRRMLYRLSYAGLATNITCLWQSLRYSNTSPVRVHLYFPICQRKFSLSHQYKWTLTLALKPEADITRNPN